MLGAITRKQYEISVRRALSWIIITLTPNHNHSQVGDPFIVPIWTLPIGSHESHFEPLDIGGFLGSDHGSVLAVVAGPDHSAVLFGELKYPSPSLPLPPLPSPDTLLILESCKLINLLLASLEKILEF